jgi:hypothetical protein
MKISHSSPTARVFFITILISLFAATFSLQASAATQYLVCAPTRISFGTNVLGTSVSQPIVVNNTGQTSTTITAISVTGSEFSVSAVSLPAVLAAGQSLSLSVIFSPTAKGWAGGTIAFTSSSDPTLSLPVEGTGSTTQAVTAAPASLSFGQVPVGTSATVSVALTNTLTCKETLTSLLVRGSPFSVSGATFPVVMSPHGTITLSVTFTPQTGGATDGSVFVNGPGLNIPVTGTGAVAQLTVAPTTLSFGSVDVGTTATQVATLTASGGSVTISSAVSSNSQFTISGASFPLTLNAGQGSQLDVVFSPTGSGADSATLTLTTNCSQPQITESLTGTGVAPQYTVDLSWNASVSSSIVGYNVYRGTAVGSYTKINSSVDSNTSYTDSTVASGTTYYYAATAVNSSGEESVYSTPLEVIIP